MRRLAVGDDVNVRGWRAQVSGWTEGESDRVDLVVFLGGGRVDEERGVFLGNVRLMRADRFGRPCDWWFRTKVRPSPFLLGGQPGGVVTVSK